MKYALLEHKHGDAGIVNYGDHIQSLAAEQYLPKLDFYVERDRLNKPDYPEGKIILNGWFTYAPENWPPNENLDPLFVSFHLNPRFAPKLLSDPKNVAYLKRHAPIGCRDYRTLDIMQKAGIDAYFSFCLTTTLDIKYKQKKTTEDIYFADVLYDYDQRYVYKADPKRVLYHLATGRIFKTMNLPKKNSILRELVPKDVIEQAINVNHFCDNKLPTPAIYDIARNTLRNYSTAKMVVTSRIHCALPCLAMGTPVLFIFNGLDDDAGHLSRFRGTVDHLNILSSKPEKEINEIFGMKMNVIHPEDVDWSNPPANPETFRPLAEKLKSTCRNFIEQ